MSEDQPDDYSPPRVDPTPVVAGVALTSAVLAPFAFFLVDPVLGVGLAGLSVLAGVVGVVTGLVVYLTGHATSLTVPSAILAPVPFLGLVYVIIESGFPGAPGRPVRRVGRRQLGRVRRGAGSVRPIGGSLLPREREELAAHWTEMARAELASVPAFRELAADLERLGAPESLVARASKAADDEARHASFAFGVAGGLAGVELVPELASPGPRPVSTLVEVAVVSMLDGAYNEGCAAREAAWAADEAVDETLRAGLSRVAREEAEHAALGLDVARWAAEVGGRRVWWAVALALRGLRAPPRTERSAAPAGWGVSGHDPRLEVREALRRTW